MTHLTHFRLLPTSDPRRGGATLQLPPTITCSLWGATKVSAETHFSGQYLGDVWAYDFKTLSFSQVRLAPDENSPFFRQQDLQALSYADKVRVAKELMERSNHTSIFYRPHNAIYVFGGGHAHKKRFNDTLKITLLRIADSSDLVCSDNFSQSSLQKVCS